MKRNKSVLAGLCTLILTVALAMGSVSYTPAFATASASTFVLGDVNIQSTVSYGDSISVPDKSGNGFTVSVTAPNGTAATIEGNAVKADQLGHYTVTYTKDGLSYSFKTYCALDEELELFVSNEAQIPSYVKTGDAKEFPSAYVGYTDEDGNIVAFEGDATVAIRTDKGEDITAGEDFTFSDAGSVFIVYSARISGGSKYLTKTYEVKVQDDFTDTTAPRLSVSGVPGTANVNTAVTLPVATATDSFDERVEIVVTVKGRDANGSLVDVKQVTVDDNDLAVSETDDNEIFDNDKNMTFYPVREGEYKVTYKAIDDNGNESAEWSYTITCSDKRAPVITLEETAIPARWGYTKVVKIDPDDDENTIELTGEDIAVKFPFPEAFDNKDEASALTIGFSLRDPESRTVLNFTNINQAAEASGTTYTNSVTNVQYTFNNTMSELAFSFEAYVNAIKNDRERPNYVYEGDYVATYTAQDAAGNRSTRTYTINIAETFEDTGVVEIEFASLPAYIAAKADERVEFIAPTPTYSSETDTRLTLTYDIYNADPLGASTALGAELQGGETLEIIYDDGYKLVYEDMTLEISGNSIFLVATATSDAGNTASVTEEVTVLTPVTKMFDSGKIVDTGITLTGHTTANKVHNLGSLAIGGLTNDTVDYVGVEIGVKDSLGAYLTSLSADIYATKAGNTKLIENISFEARTAGDYVLEIRVFDVYGNSDIMLYPVTITAAASGGISGSSVVSVSTADVNAKFVLSNETIDLSGALPYIGSSVAGTDFLPVLIHSVKGGRFSLMGEEFTALSTGKYAFSDKGKLVTTSGSSTEGVLAISDFVPAKGNDSDGEYAARLAALEQYLASVVEGDEYVTVSDSTDVRFELQGIMPSYVEFSGTVTLPAVTAFTSNANAEEIVLNVTNPSGGKVTPYTGESDARVNLASDGKISGDTEYKFDTTAHGTYTVVYSVKMSGKEAVTFNYTIKAGDVVAPTFSLTDASGNAASHTQSVRSGYTFNFMYVAASDETTDNPASLTYTKRVTGPDGEVVGGTISGRGTTYANRLYPTSGEFTLDSSGTYTVTYTVTDEAGNAATREFTITVTNSSGNGGISLAALSTILIVIGVLLIAGVIVYLFRFRRVKKD